MVIARFFNITRDVMICIILKEYFIVISDNSIIVNNINKVISITRQ